VAAARVACLIADAFSINGLLLSRREPAMVVGRAG
jgi:hypothetical protein